MSMILSSDPENSYTMSENATPTSITTKWNPDGRSPVRNCIGIETSSCIAHPLPRNSLSKMSESDKQQVAAKGTSMWASLDTGVSNQTYRFLTFFISTCCIWWRMVSPAHSRTIVAECSACHVGCFLKWTALAESRGSYARIFAVPRKCLKFGKNEEKGSVKMT